MITLFWKRSLSQRILKWLSLTITPILNELLAAAQRLRSPNQHPKQRTDKLELALLPPLVNF
jgi:hypothetical protein